MRSMHLVFSLAIAVAACSKEAPAHKTTPAVADPIPMGEASQPTETAAASSRAVLAAYERVRASLAADDLSGVPDAARELETSAKAAATDSTAHFTAIAAAAPKLAEAPDLKAARASFGEISQHLVALLAADKALAAGQHVFECSMAAGYKKWVQPSKDLGNPYMGKRMLACGVPGTLE